MLFAETCEVLDVQPHWAHIRLHNDKQEGYVDSKMITLINEREQKQLNEDKRHEATVILPMTYAVSEGNAQTLPLTAGTRLPAYLNGTFHVLNAKFRIDPNAVITSPMPLTQDFMLQALRFFLNTPYLWGGKNALGMDCSGFTQVFYSFFGFNLPRNASEQYQYLQPTDISIDRAKAGDIAFFNHGEKDKITHVGILLDSQRVVHCSGRVKIEQIDNHGIFSREANDNEHKDGQYTHNLVAIGRLNTENRK